MKKASDIEKKLSKFSPLLDERTEVSPGYKFHEWELKGIPIRLEFGPQDMEKKQVILVKRNDGKKIPVKITDLEKTIPEVLEKIQAELFEKAENVLKSNIKKAEEKKDLIKFIKEKQIVISPMCKADGCEELLIIHRPCFSASQRKEMHYLRQKRGLHGLHRQDILIISQRTNISQKLSPASV